MRVCGLKFAIFTRYPRVPHLHHRKRWRHAMRHEKPRPHEVGAVIRYALLGLGPEERRSSSSILS